MGSVDKEALLASEAAKLAAWDRFKDGFAFGVDGAARAIQCSRNYTRHLLEELVIRGVIVEVPAVIFRVEKLYRAKPGKLVAAPETCQLAIEAITKSKYPLTGESRHLASRGIAALVGTKSEWESSRTERIAAIAYVRDHGRAYSPIADKHRSGGVADAA